MFNNEKMKRFDLKVILFFYSGGIVLDFYWFLFIFFIKYLFNLFEIYYKFFRKVIVYNLFFLILWKIFLFCL